MRIKLLAFAYAAALAAGLSFAAGVRAQDAPAAGGEKVYKAAEVDEKAVIDRQSQRANIPEGYRCGGGQGVVRLRAVLHKSGEVKEVAVVKASGCPDFDESALRSVRRIAFAPAKKGGQLVSQYGLFEFSYRVN